MCKYRFIGISSIQESINYTQAKVHKSARCSRLNIIPRCCLFVLLTSSRGSKGLSSDCWSGSMAQMMTARRTGSLYLYKKIDITFMSISVDVAAVTTVLTFFIHPDLCYWHIFHLHLPCSYNDFVIMRHNGEVSNPFCFCSTRHFRWLQKDAETLIVSIYNKS